MKNRPGIFTALGQSYLRSLIKPTPLWVHLYVTRHCNLNCAYCGARDNKRKDPSFDEIKTRLRKLKSLGCGVVSLMGGEPTLRRDIVDIVRYCSEVNLYTQVATNGAYLINPVRFIDQQPLLRHLVDAGLGTVNLSVDSVTGEFGASEKELPKASAVLDALIKEKNNNGLVVILNCVITRNNVDQVPAMLEFCQTRKLMMAAIFAQNPHPSLEYGLTEYNKSILFSGKDAKKVAQTADYLIQKKQSGYQLVEPIQYYEGIKQWVKDGIDWQCTAGLYSLVVDTDGALTICGYLPFTTLNISHLPADLLPEIVNYRKKYLTWCTKKCLPSCMFCTSYYRQHPVSFLYSKLRYR